MWDEYRGVQVSVGSGRDAVRDAAMEKMRQALDLLAGHAPAQLERIRTHMHGVFVGPISGVLASWRRGMRACIVSEDYVLDPETTAEDLASTLIHELTHARLDARAFGYDERVRARIERVCFLAERNWAARLPSSEAQEALERRTAAYLALPADHWTDAARMARFDARARSGPLLTRAMWWARRIARHMREAGAGRSGAP